jgi:hypothetical protein
MNGWWYIEWITPRGLTSTGDGCEYRLVLMVVNIVWCRLQRNVPHPMKQKHSQQFVEQNIGKVSLASVRHNGTSEL